VDEDVGIIKSLSKMKLYYQNSWTNSTIKLMCPSILITTLELRVLKIPVVPFGGGTCLNWWTNVG
jgi:hypothetical protein